jgi:hypothetical protein
MEAMLQPESETVWFVLEDLDKTVAGYWFFYSNFCNANSLLSNTTSLESIFLCRETPEDHLVSIPEAVLGYLVS